MATQAARSAFEAINELPQQAINEEARNREPRYLFYSGDEPGMPDPGGISVSSPCIPDKTIWRCAVTPALSAPVRMRAQEIPEGRKLDGTEDGKGLASMLLPCGPEVDELLANYGHPDRSQWQKRWGLVELTELRGMLPRDVAALNLTTTFFPEWPNIPQTNREVEAMLKAKLAEIKDADSVIAKTGKQMLDAVSQAQSYQSKLIQSGNMRVTYPDTNDGFKPGFDSKDELFAVRSGVGLAVNSLRGNSSDANAAGIGAVLEAVMSKFQPQAAAPIDASQIAAIVAATMQAMNAQPTKVAVPVVDEAKPEVPKLGIKK